jgi:hypothetical protein
MVEKNLGCGTLDGRKEILALGLLLQCQGLGFEDRSSNQVH